MPKLIDDNDIQQHTKSQPTLHHDSELVSQQLQYSSIFTPRQKWLIVGMVGIATLFR
jgi:hypothetical protein